jgi:hypothetical protein
MASVVVIIDLFFYFLSVKENKRISLVRLEVDWAFTVAKAVLGIKDLT